jgi:2-phospho-L-lactate/phosphoenolpyruvate guanylyltransferase
MPTIVVPFRGTNGKQRLAPLSDEARAALSLAMLADVLTACTVVGETLVVTSDEEGARVARELEALVVPDPGGGQGAAVAAALARARDRRALVVNGDLPCVVPDDIRVLDRATPDDGIAYVAARDGTTNALGLSRGRLFAPLYGHGSAARFRSDARERGFSATPAAIANLVDDVDALEDLDRVQRRVGPRTRAVLAR